MDMCSSLIKILTAFYVVNYYCYYYWLLLFSPLLVLIL
jgi:hypothetical protein